MIIFEIEIEKDKNKAKSKTKTKTKIKPEMSTPENANPEKIDSEKIDSEISQEEKVSQWCQETHSELKKLLSSANVIPLEQQLSEFVTEAERKVNEVLKKLSAISDEENEENEETEEAEKLEEVEKMSFQQKSSKFLNCANQLVIRKDAFSHAYEHPSDNRHVRIWFSVGHEIRSLDIDVPPGEGSVIRNIYEQLSE